MKNKQIFLGGYDFTTEYEEYCNILGKSNIIVDENSIGFNLSALAKTKESFELPCGLDHYTIENGFLMCYFD